ncbi:MAG: MarR family transcriptional regulator [Tistrella sp.]|nr:MarR family transcriptional regulator [Tistrella sp.]MAD39009.1 MarR family transcriptional regulator [Tistrella sp.]MBA74760.1 MarR family transcriptional regulator [Tistrella sp.]|tara:strand:- start:118 stop:585 length:468 start_codon:yes stop_codon:yes gene_type:complete
MKSRPATLRSDVTNELATASRKMRTGFDALVRTRGLTLARARALMLLARHPGISQTELAGLLEIENPTVVRLLDGLEKQGLIRRTPAETDRRVKRIDLTVEAEDQVDEIEDLAEVMRGTMARGIAEADLTVTLNVLRRMIANLESGPAADDGEAD